MEKTKLRRYLEGDDIVKTMGDDNPEPLEWDKDDIFITKNGENSVRSIITEIGGYFGAFEYKVRETSAGVLSVINNENIFVATVVVSDFTKNFRITATKI